MNYYDSVVDLEQLERYLFDTVPLSTPVIIDIETISFNDKEEAFQAYAGHRSAMIGIKWVNRDPITVAIRHRSAKTLMPLEQTCALLAEWATQIQNYVNANPKFDQHFMIQDGILLSNSNLRIFDTQIMGRLYDNSLMSYSLSSLCTAFNLEHTKSKAVEAWTEQMKTKDYGAVPLDLLGKYLIDDLYATEGLYAFLLQGLKARK
jgi:DNA polymerase I-like protein with 3'-5' exonuclease and polymerase domains